VLHGGTWLVRYSFTFHRINYRNNGGEQRGRRLSFLDSTATEEEEEEEEELQKYFAIIITQKYFGRRPCYYFPRIVLTIAYL